MRPIADQRTRLASILSSAPEGALPAGGTLVACALLLAVERDLGSLPFCIALCATLTSAALLMSARPRFSLLVAATAMVLSAVSSMGKYKFLSMNAHVIDLWFYIRGGETPLFLLSEFPLLVSAGVAALGGATASLVFFYRREVARTGLERAAALSLVLSIAALPATLPPERSEMSYHIRKNHFASSFFISFADLPKLMRPAPVFGDLGSSQSAQVHLRGSICTAENLPDIVLVLAESAVPPSLVPGWKFAPGVLTRFMSDDDQIHRAGVETHGGGTWISEASVMTGLSMADLGWMRSYPTMLLQGRVHNGLPAALAACGYETKVLSTASYYFVGNGPFMSSLGFTDYVDRRRLAATSQHEPDHWYFDRALQMIDDHHRTSNKPLFLFVETVTAHAPYDFRFEPNRIARGEPFGNNDPAVDEYLRRLTFAREDFHAFKDRIDRSRRPTLVASFGDHHPYMSSNAFAAAGRLPKPDDYTTPMHQTFYDVSALNFEPAAALPDVPVLDLAYLGVTLMDVAGVPLDAAATQRLALRDLCGGRFHSCTRRSYVDAYLARLVASGLVASL